jgi:hypothetical protein
MTVLFAESFLEWLGGMGLMALFYFLVACNERP